MALGNHYIRHLLKTLIVTRFWKCDVNIKPNSWRHIYRSCQIIKHVMELRGINFHLKISKTFCNLRKRCWTYILSRNLTLPESLLVFLLMPEKKNLLNCAENVFGVYRRLLLPSGTMGIAFFHRYLILNLTRIIFVPLFQPSCIRKALSLCCKSVWTDDFWAVNIRLLKTAIIVCKLKE